MLPNKLGCLPLTNILALFICLQVSLEPHSKVRRLTDIICRRAYPNVAPFVCSTQGQSPDIFSKYMTYLKNCMRQNTLAYFVAASVTKKKVCEHNHLSSICCFALDSTYDGFKEFGWTMQPNKLACLPQANILALLLCLQVSLEPHSKVRHLTDIICRRAYPNVAPFVCSTQGQSPGIFSKYMTWLKNCMQQNTSLFRRSIDDKEKSFWAYHLSSICCFALASTYDGFKEFWWTMQPNKLACLPLANILALFICLQVSLEPHSKVRHLTDIICRRVYSNVTPFVCSPQGQSPGIFSKCMTCQKIVCDKTL